MESNPAPGCLVFYIHAGWAGWHEREKKDHRCPALSGNKTEGRTAKEDHMQAITWTATRLLLLRMSPPTFGFS